MMNRKSEELPRDTAELEDLADCYGNHDTSAEMGQGERVEPQPMATTSLRPPAAVIDKLKRQARTRHVRYTSYVRSILERAARGGTAPEIADVTQRLERIERAVTSGQPRQVTRHPERWTPLARGCSFSCSSRASGTGRQGP